MLEFKYLQYRKRKLLNLRKFTVFIFTAIAMLFTQVYAATTAEVKQLIIKQSKEMGVEPAIMLSLAKTESGFRQDVKGASGNIGVFQLFPATAKKMGYNAYDLNENIKAGITYYKNMYKTFGSTELAVAAYNSGPDAVKRYKAVPPSSKVFVNRIMTDYKYFQKNM
ncbi:MAG: transglycosylase SLT domain-containing protein [Candidatus Gastranaerophilaceae bacterium]|jgi:soluble lytic murein transglycosylase-like protein|nr:transglycosylase SLT domain-containing protein [Candidatus Gastranaerophilaceae bacterium]